MNVIVFLFGSIIALDLVLMPLSDCTDDMTLETLNGSMCSNYGEIVLTPTSTVVFKCTYESPDSVTTYRWSLNGIVRIEFTSNIASIPILSGSHNLTCEAFIEIAICTCTDSRTLNVTVVGMCCCLVLAFTLRLWKQAAINTIWPYHTNVMHCNVQS